MITRIEARNFRCLQDVSQPLARLHVLVGPNGSGKSGGQHPTRSWVSSGCGSVLSRTGQALLTVWWSSITTAAAGKARPARCSKRSSRDASLALAGVGGQPRSSSRRRSKAGFGANLLRSMRSSAGQGAPPASVLGSLLEAGSEGSSRTIPKRPIARPCLPLTESHHRSD